MKDKAKILILLSSFNGLDRINNQIDSILKQIGVNVSILIRDDGSNRETIEILNNIENKYKNIKVIYGKNIGWKSSFMELLYCCPIEYDFYGFSDQDDIWFEDKLLTLIRTMSVDKNNIAKLAHCNSISVDSELIKREEQEKRIACPPSFKAAITTEYFQGCGMVWNREAMELIREYIPQNKDLAHDYWVGLVCFLFGKTYFVEKELFYHIRYGNNSSNDGDILKGRLSRVKLFWSDGCVYMNPVKDILLGYEALLDAEQVNYLQLISTYKESLKNKIKLLCDVDFRRESFASTIIFKIAILLNRF